MKLDVPDVAAMENLGGNIAKNCPVGTKVFLQGALGAGKTTLVRGFLREFGYSGVVKSPTYTLIEPYEIKGSTVYHFDLYRLNAPEELETIGLRDYFDQAAICLVEWPEKAGSRLGVPDLLVHIEDRKGHRQVFLDAQGPLGRTAIKNLT